jgi:hypothetical protein
MRRLLLPLSFALLAACGGVTTSGLPARAPSATQALTATAELLEFETSHARLEMFREVARISQVEAGHVAAGPVLFPLVQNGQVIGAPALDPRADLLAAGDSGHPLQLAFDGRGDRWSDERREGLQGLSEREAVELVARTLLAHWGLKGSGVVQVSRSPGAPYAAAYVDGILRVNPAFIYMAVGSSNPAGVQ